jgi:hypothetical protein
MRLDPWIDLNCESNFVGSERTDLARSSFTILPHLSLNSQEIIRSARKSHHLDSLDRG